MPIIETKNISYTYSGGTPFEHAALREVDFCAFSGEYIAVIGHTGSGKSTFIQHLNGLLKPQSGQVLLLGEDIHSSKQATRRARFNVGLVFQFPEYQLFEETVARDIAFGPRNMGLAQSEIEARVARAARFVGLSAQQLEQSPFDLSGGQKRRAAVAGVIAMEPRVLILDEPTAGLDPQGRAELLSNIDAYRRETGAAIITVTHSMEEAARCATRVCVFENGRLVMNGPPAEIFAGGGLLEGMGLSLPAPAQIAARLRARGLEIPRGIYTVSALRDAVLSLREVK
ncbi:MAG: energy-coupling factor transporter ATPase [Oscillospiraceae bacterium]|jgi:energy-coupling factor transport system ATP-binding protein|nr:energy-coupling factor transporter ATPase [Oscillospiraceae bacterium]